MHEPRKQPLALEVLDLCSINCNFTYLQFYTIQRLISGDGNVK
jgi:hypothetical protein